MRVLFFFQAEDGIRDVAVTEFRRVLFRSLAHKLGIAQPEANHLRRGLKVPREELCIKMAKLLGKNPVELMLVAQKDRAPAEAKEYWELARTAVDVMLHVPSHPRYLPRKVEAIGKELRQMEAQCLLYENGAAETDRKSTRLNSSHGYISYAVFCLKKKTLRTIPSTEADRALTSKTLYELDVGH